MKKIIISKQDVEKIVAYAREKLPNEACGLIAGTENEEEKCIERVYFLNNTDASSEHFSLDPKEQLQAVKDMRIRGLTPLGNWHSHPESPSQPSREDKRLAYDSKASYLILSLMEKEPVLNSFHMENGEDYQEVLEIQDTINSVTVEELLKVDFSKVIIVDLREPDEVLIKGISGAVNIPFDKISTELSKLPKDKPIYVFCRTGDFSEEVTEILIERGYDAYNIEGGYDAYEKYLAAHPVKVDAKAMKCPGPIVKVADTIRNLKDGQRIVAEATEEAFFSDIRVWCERTGNKLISLEKKQEIIEAVIEKTGAKINQNTQSTADTELPDGKTFVVFSGDLDKTIAAFIMANGAAAMGREVTIFFTFWGLNILRKPKKVKVKKNVVEKMFGFMMPRGTLKLGLSRMNMGGLGAKMIRWIMKKHNVQSLEELIQQAVEHGVHLVACQMSMEIMGIRKEELIDGVELGGVATFLGSGEKSNMSLFI